mmetsp:Transcript_38187/g.114250  ORF Transcript_38187/g.114250 Transcript_38187/m.114250 type:complete len:228 (-) Transcript_38187:526-1209(-)
MDSRSGARASPRESGPAEETARRRRVAVVEGVVEGVADGAVTEGRPLSASPSSAGAMHEIRSPAPQADTTCSLGLLPCSDAELPDPRQQRRPSGSRRRSAKLLRASDRGARRSVRRVDVLACRAPTVATRCIVALSSPSPPSSGETGEAVSAAGGRACPHAKSPLEAPVGATSGGRAAKSGRSDEQSIADGAVEEGTAAAAHRSGATAGGRPSGRIRGLPAGAGRVQ